MAKQSLSTTPNWPTMVAGRLTDGRLISIDGSVWLYRKVPMAPVAEAKTGERAMLAGVPLDLAFEEVAALTNISGNRRGLVRSAYRETHTLLVNIPTLFQPQPSPIETYLREQFPSTIVDSRVLLFGVRLQSSVGSGGLASAISSVAESIVSGGTPMSDYDRDFAEVDDAMKRAGLSPLTPADLRLANAWWNHGTNPDTPALFHSDHMHVFGSGEATQVAQNLGADRCADWPPIEGAHWLSFASVQDFDLPYVDAQDTAAKWVAPLIQAGAAVVSVRNLVEPAKVTREELRRQRKGYTDDLNARFKEGKMDRAELDSKLSELGAVEEIYSTGNGPTTLVDTSIVVAFDGYVPDMTSVSSAQVKLSSMLFRQQQAWAETMLCSIVRANPNLHDLPVPTVAYSGLPGLSTVGDREGALVGFTEGDRQPALLSPTAVAKEDTYPLCVVAAASGAGKSMMMLWLADQYARMGRPVVIIDPKALTLDTPVVTPTGFVRNGDLVVGDKVIGRDGQICSVTALSPIFATPDLYEIEFDDGQIITADAEHRWVVSDRSDRRRMRAAGASDGRRVIELSRDGEFLRDMTTAELVERGLKTKGGGAQFSVPLTEPVDLRHSVLDVAPYTFGVSLVGDSVRNSENPDHQIDGQGIKNIPSEYLLGSAAQRFALLQGIMDTDGGVAVTGALRITLSAETLAHDALSLVRSLGIKAKVSGRTVTFHTRRRVFLLSPKAKTHKRRAFGRTDAALYIKSIRPVASQPARCIRVDSADHTYLAAGYVVTHNTGSSHDGAVRASGGQVASLDDLMSADGVLDPLRFAITVEDGVEMAASMLLTVNPFGQEKLNYEVPLIAALNFGVAQGAKCIGQALQIAVNSGRAPKDMVDRVIDLADASPQFRAMVGFNPATQGLRIVDGITLIKVGRGHLNLPSPGTAPEHLDISQRVSLSLVRMMLFGSATALTGRDGVIMQDEAWTILNADPKEVERLGRLARSQRVLPILFSQDISGAVRAGLQGFISRGFIGPIGDPVEARAALDLFGIEATPERMARVTAPGTTDSYGTDEFAAPNWNSMKALRDPRTRETLRGSVWLYSDLAGRVIPVECTIPPEFLKLASTNAADIDSRATQS
jgi:Mrp family chromosome partitioning ATPase